MTSTKRHRLTVMQKLQLIEDLEKNGFSQRKAAIEFGISESAVSKILKRKEALHKDFHAGKALANHKKQGCGHFPEMEKAPYNWFCKQRGKGHLLSGEFLGEEVKRIGARLNPQKHQQFSYSDRWFDRFKRRYHIAFRRAHGEKASADAEAARAWCENRLPALLESFKPSDIFNGDESGLYFRGMPDRYDFSSRNISRTSLP